MQSKQTHIIFAKIAAVWYRLQINRKLYLFKTQSSSDWLLLFYDETFHHITMRVVSARMTSPPSTEYDSSLNWCFDKHENDINHMLLLLRSPDHHQHIHISFLHRSFGKTIFQIQFQRFVKAMARHTKSVLVAHDGLHEITYSMFVCSLICCPFLK